jgi:hypothetical protein
MKRTLKYIAYGLAVLLMAWLVFKVVDLASQQRESDQSQAARDRTAATNAKALQDANAKVTALSDQIKSLGKKPVVSSKPVVVTGDRGPGPTPGQVAVAIQQYCFAHGGCRGPAGPPGLTVVGPKGDKGDKGDTVTGPPGGSGPSGPAGKDGADGKNGADGKDGRGVQSTQCGDDGRWTVTYTDGSTEDAGVCRVLGP